MADASYFRDKAGQAMRLAKESTDPILTASLTEFALEYFARAVAIEAQAFGKDPDENEKAPA
jgi:alkanesulfonate monooxygenase SsuD/methylene tetrahydromethanopterin reductase-like flavin-dependent oxidoreductase (luciferase family)